MVPWPWSPWGRRPLRVPVEDPRARARLAAYLARELEVLCALRPGCPAVVCIGTDRSTGDALGPLVGSFLAEGGWPLAAGTLDSPLHAGNLARALSLLDPHGPLVAVDACLGAEEHVGWVLARPGPLHPGSALGRQLPVVGDLHVSGVVQAAGVLDAVALLTTPLSTVVRMARLVADSLLDARRAITGACGRHPG